MPKLSEPERAAFLTEPHILMRIAVVRSDGSPLVTPIWFIYEDDAIYFTPRAQSEWLPYLRNDGRVALCIDEESLPYRKLIVEGKAEIHHDLGQDDLWRDRYRRMAQRYLSKKAADHYIQSTIDQPRALFALPLSKAVMRSWRMPVGDEPEQGIWAQHYYASESNFSTNRVNRTSNS